MTLIIGVDPGLAGAIAFYRPEAEILEIQDMPALSLCRGGKAKRAIDHYALARIVDAKVRATATYAYVERVGAMPGQGTSSMFAFGRSAGIVIGVLAANFIPITEVAPTTWKRAVGIPAGSGKDASRAAIVSMFPRHSALFARARDDDRADAALLAVYGARVRAHEAT